MAKNSSVKTVMIIGAGPIVIGQACEFDYSGTQACKALKSEGYRVVLINSNPATIMTDPGVADVTYIEPITAECIEKIIVKEKPDLLLPTVGGQTALNVSLELEGNGTLQKYGVKMIGANPDAIDKAENRRRFNEAMARIGLEVPKNHVVDSMEAAREALKDIGLPAIVRPSFTLGGSGGGIAYTTDDFERIVAYGLDMSPTHQVLIDECLNGWKEYEMEVIRDKKDNAIIVCSIENVDPMGVHTGDSITVAPALTLTDKEYQRMRSASIAVLREIGVETGGSNVQFAVNPQNGRMVVIEMNPRVSRSSALASKATGFPIAKVAAKLAVGYTLDQIQNDITKITPASFEPTIDYVVTKIPRFTFEKFNIKNPELSTSMKSVGEAMAIGRSFAESFQKALRSLETGLTGLNEPVIANITPATGIEEKRRITKELLARFSPERPILIAQALRYGISEEEISAITHYDPWFIEQIKNIVDAEDALCKNGMPKDRDGLLQLKKMGFSDARLAELTGESEDNILRRRHSLGVVPVFKVVDTCSAEFPSKTPYLYSCYESYAGSAGVAACEANPSGKKKVIILGGGPNRIGQGIEFDYACVHAALSLKEEGIESIMINCNPETVSTDYDTSDKLYFEPLYHEDVLEIILKERRNGDLLGVIVQFGGQTPLKLCKTLDKHKIKILGTSSDMIDVAEDRDRFRALMERLKLQQPENTIRHKIDQIQAGIEEIGFPVVIRPSNVLGGRAMAILHHHEDLTTYLQNNRTFLLDGPILIDKFLEQATEIDVDALSDGDEVFIAGIMEHVEEAGIHSGDSACCIPSLTLSDSMLVQIKESTIKIAKALEIVGLMNIQYAIYQDELFVIEVNPRASRTVPYVAKSTGNSLAKIATKLMVGKRLADFPLNTDVRYYNFKECVFPFARFDGADTILGPEMKSTGEVMGTDKNPLIAFAKAQMAAGNYIRKNKVDVVLLSIDDQDKSATIQLAKDLISYNPAIQILATKGTFDFLQKNNVSGNLAWVAKAYEHAEHNVVTMLNQKQIDLVIVTTRDIQKIARGSGLRRAALMNRIPYVTTMKAAKLFVGSLIEVKKYGYDVVSLQQAVGRVAPQLMASTADIG